MFLPIVAAMALDASRLQVGTSWAGEEVLHFHSKESEIDETHRFKLKFRISGKEDGMWLVERQSSLLGSRIMDTDIPPPPSQEPLVTKEWLSPVGFLLDIQPFDKGQFGLDRLIHFWLPANLPPDWAADLNTSTNGVAQKARAEFKAIAKQPGSYTLRYTSIEDEQGISATGRMRFDVKSGRLLQAKLEAKSALLPGGLERSNVTLTYTDSYVTKPLD